MRKVTDIGAFTADSRDIINQNFTDINADYYIDANCGYDGNPGTSAGLAFKSMTPLTTVLPAFRRKSSSVITVAFDGVLLQEYTTPIVSDVSLVGAANQPRQATTSGVANGGGATWLSPSGGTGALLTVRGQSWSVRNIYFNNSATAAPCVQLLMNGAGDPPIDASAEHASFYNCFFTGADDGLQSSGGPNFATIDSCRFFGFSGTGDIAISSTVGAGVHSLYGWVIKHCEFWGNTRHIQAGLNSASIHHNHFSYINNGVTTAIFYDATGGLNNAVYKNVFDVDSGNGGIAAMFVLGTNDRFSANALSTAVATTQFSWGDPA